MGEYLELAKRLAAEKLKGFDEDVRAARKEYVRSPMMELMRANVEYKLRGFDEAVKAAKNYR